MKALIDGDSIAYRAAASVEKVKYLVQTPPASEELLDNFHEVDSWKDARAIDMGTIWSRREVGSLEQAKMICDSFMRRIRENTSDDYNLFLTPTSGNFRDTLARHTRYKATRDGLVRPLYLADIRDYLHHSYSGQVVKFHEAEDEVSIQACRIGQDGYVVVGIDKDLMQIPGRHYDWVKNEFFDISSLEATQALWMQVLMGDRTDNIPGCWGMGFQKAKNRITKWIPTHEEFIIDIIAEEYEKSKKVKGCPYAEESEEDTYTRVYETYWLVKLKEYADETPWYPKIQNKKKIVLENDGKTKAKSEIGTSGCVQIASERGSSGATATSISCATPATDSDTPTP